MTTNDDPMTVGLNLEPWIAKALKTACGATLDSYAGLCRKAVVSMLRQEGYLPPLDTPRRHRVARRPKAAA